jgi:hypothetical protein
MIVMVDERISPNPRPFAANGKSNKRGFKFGLAL